MLGEKSRHLAVVKENLPTAKPNAAVPFPRGWLSVPFFQPSLLQPGWGCGFPAFFTWFLSNSRCETSFPVSLRGSTWGRDFSIQDMFFWGFQCDDLGDRSLLTGSGAAQQPVTRVDQLEVHSAFYLFRWQWGGEKKNVNKAQIEPRSLAGGDCRDL